MNRLYVVETAVTSTGAKADHRLALPVQEIEGLARPLAAKLGVAAGGNTSSPHEKWTTAVAKDLEQHRGRCLMLAGERQPAVVHLLAIAQPEVGKRRPDGFLHRPIEHQPAQQTASLKELTDDMQQGRVWLLLVLGANPVYNAPVDFKFADHWSTSRCASTSDSTRMKRLASATGICPRPTIWKRGAMPARTMARPRSAAVDRAPVRRPLARGIGGFSGHASRNAGRGNGPKPLARSLEREQAEIGVRLLRVLENFAAQRHGRWHRFPAQAV